MPYIRRDAAGLIASLHRDAESASDEFVPDDDAGVRAFVGQTEGPAFGRLDADFVRVIEDVIDALIVKNVINITDLPAEAQVKLFERKTFRERVSKSSLRLFEPTDFGDII